MYHCRMIDFCFKNFLKQMNDMKGHYFTKLVTEQRRLGGTSWPRKDNLVVRGEPPVCFEFCAFQHLEREFLAIKMDMFS